MARPGGTSQLARGLPPVPRLRPEYQIRSILPQQPLHLPLWILLSRLHILPSPLGLRSLPTDVWTRCSSLLRSCDWHLFRVRNPSFLFSLNNNLIIMTILFEMLKAKNSLISTLNDFTIISVNNAFIAFLTETIFTCGWRSRRWRFNLGRTRSSRCWPIPVPTRTRTGTTSTRRTGFSLCCTLPPARCARRSTKMRCWCHFPSCLPGNFLLHSTLNIS